MGSRFGYRPPAAPPRTFSGVRCTATVTAGEPEPYREDLPDNIHISLDLLRRDLAVAPTEIVESMRAMTALGFEQEIRTAEHHVIVVSSSDTTN